MRNKNGLIRLIISIICCAVLFCAVFPASVSGAASDKIISNTESVKNNRIFSVPVSIKSDKMLTAATFTLSYDKNAVSYRSVETDIDDAIVKAYDEDGKTTVIFLHGDGVSLSDTPLLLNVRYNDKLYTFAMNGQTGKFVGELPSDRGKLIRIAITVFLAVTAAGSALQYLFYMMR